jgi:hypothetical protein
MLAAIVSRAFAILILSVPTGYILYEMDNRDWQIMQEYSHEELLAYLESVLVPSHLVAILIVFLVGCGTVACVEALAWTLRRLTLGSGTPVTHSE